MKRRLSLLLAGVLAAGAVLTGCGGEEKVSSQSSQVFAMDTVMLLTVYGDQAQQGLDQPPRPSRSWRSCGLPPMKPAKFGP